MTSAIRHQCSVWSCRIGSMRSAAGGGFACAWGCCLCRCSAPPGRSPSTPWMCLGLVPDANCELCSSLHIRNSDSMMRITSSLELNLTNRNRCTPPSAGDSTPRSMHFLLVPRSWLLASNARPGKQESVFVAAHYMNLLPGALCLVAQHMKHSPESSTMVPDV